MIKRHIFDFILILSLFTLCVTLFFVWFFSIKGTKGNYVHIYCDNKEILIVDLKKDDVYEIDGTISKMEIHVENGYVNVSYSGCKNQVCVHHLAICNIGSSIICLPNKVEVRVEKDE